MTMVSPPRGGGTRRGSHARRQADWEHHGAGSERWLLTYSDMITLLLVLFIVLFALSRIDQVKFREFKQSVTHAVLSRTPHGTTAVKSKSTSTSTSAAHLKAIEHQLKVALQARGLLRDVTFDLNKSGLVEGLVADSTFFSTNSASLSAVGVEIVDTSAGVLRRYTNAIEVAGYTDNVPIRSGPFTTNWALSAARATTVVIRMTEVDDVAPARVVILGYGQYHPVVPNTSARNRAENRRVNIVVSPSDNFEQ